MQVHIDTPYLSVSEYAKRTGQTEKAVQNDCKRGKLPCAPRVTGGKFMINNAMLIKQALEQEY